MNDKKYVVECISGHETEVGLDWLAEILEDEICPEDGCESKIDAVEPDLVAIECMECGFEEQCSWQDAAMWLYSDCPRCQKNTQTDGDIKIVGTFFYHAKEYYNFCESVDGRQFVREGRPDYTETVVHYTKQENFMNIMRTKRIEAVATGYFNKPAVCLTDVPIAYGEEFKSRYGPFGIVFKKRDIILAGGGPAVYLSDEVIREQKNTGGFSETLKPLVNVVRIPATAPAHASAKKVDYLHDREWRVPRTLELTKTEPVGIIIPTGGVYGKFAGPDGLELIRIAWEYREVRY